MLGVGACPQHPRGSGVWTSQQRPILCVDRRRKVASLASQTLSADEKLVGAVRLKERLAYAARYAAIRVFQRQFYAIVVIKTSHHFLMTPKPRGEKSL